ncbi:MAG: beta-lactamase family protein [Gemmatimonadaceae bacterium]|nr:beta-lactamase family protein [Gemmatimonadaceae bacterium]
MPSAPAMPITASVRREVTRLDGHRLSPDSVEHIVSRAMERSHVPGLAMAVINRGEIVYMAGFGYRDVARGLPLTETSVMYAASLTKAMFAHLVMQLVDDGAIDLDTPIGKLLPKPLPSYEKYADLAGDARWERITPRMLLSHTSGLPNWRFFEPEKKLRIRSDPGTHFGYSGEGINLLQLVIEEHTGKTVGDMMQARVFDRFGMTHTSMVWRPSFASEMAFGYDTAGKLVGHNQRSSARAAGSADTDIADMARFVRGVLRGEGLSAASRRMMWSPQIRIRTPHEFPTPVFDSTSRDDAIDLSYALGWGAFKSPYGPAFFKEGHDDESWRNYMVAFEEPKSAIIFLSTSANAEPMFPGLLADVLGDSYSPAEWMGYTP